MDEQTMRVLSAERTKLKTTWYTLLGISDAISSQVIRDRGKDKASHLNVSNLNLSTARDNIAEAIKNVEDAISWLQSKYDE